MDMKRKKEKSEDEAWDIGQISSPHFLFFLPSVGPVEPQGKSPKYCTSCTPAVAASEMENSLKPIHAITFEINFGGVASFCLSWLLNTEGLHKMFMYFNVL